MIQYKGVEPPHVRSHAAVVYQDSMYIWGGLSDSEFSRDLYRFHFESQTWSRVETKNSPPSGRSRMRGVIHNNRMLIIGGWDRKKIQRDFYEFNFDTLRWKVLNHDGFPTGISQYTAMIYKDVLFVFGGFVGKATNNLYGFKLFDKNSNEG